MAERDCMIGLDDLTDDIPIQAATWLLNIRCVKVEWMSQAVRLPAPW